MVFEYPIKPNPTIAKKLDQWALNLEKSVSAAVQSASEKGRRFEKSVDVWIDEKEQTFLNIAHPILRFSNPFGNFYLSFERPRLSPSTISLPFPLQVFLGKDATREVPSQPEVINDYKKALANKNPLALALFPWIDAFEKSKTKNPKELASVLEGVVSEPRFFKLIQGYLYTGDPYGRNQVLLDYTLGKDENGKPLGLEITANVWTPHQSSPPHRHVDKNDQEARGLDVVLEGQNGWEVRYREVQERDAPGEKKKRVKVGETQLTPFKANTIDDDLIHAVENRSDDQTLITFHVYWPPLQLKAPIQGAPLDFKANKEALKPVIADKPPEEANRAIEAVKKFLRNIWS